ncbi:MAG TPA: DUF3106 domain-containing protein, partial [Gammaproteobacteria bacterium]|nr:DUF3106 domain-containing protein [Gammaproteobacteria bacterium]
MKTRPLLLLLLVAAQNLWAEPPAMQWQALSPEIQQVLGQFEENWPSLSPRQRQQLKSLGEK